MRRFFRWLLPYVELYAYPDQGYDLTEWDVDVDDVTAGRAYVTGTGQVLRGVHDPALCAGHPCVIHAPSDHSMRAFPTHWRSGGPFDIKPPHMERICPHGIGHPDPDDSSYLRSIGEDVSVHGCDGCCR